MLNIKNLFILIIFLIISLIFIIPNISVKYNLITKTKNVETTFKHFSVNDPISSDQLHYLRTIRGLEKDFFNYKFQLKEEGKTYSPTYFFIPIYLGFFVSKILGSLENFVDFKNFIFVFINLTLCFYLLRLLSINFSIALLSSVFIICGYNFNLLINLFFFNYQYLINNGNYIFLTAEKYPSQFVLSYIFLFYIYFCKNLINFNNKNLLLLGIIAGLSFYTYFYSILIFGIQLFIFNIFLFYKFKNFKIKYSIPILIYVLIGTPYILNFLNYYFNPDFHLFETLIDHKKFSFSSVSKSVAEVTTIVIISLLITFIICKIDKKYLILSLITLSIGVPIYLIGIISSFFKIVPEVQHYFSDYEWPIFQIFIIVIILDFFIYGQGKTYISKYLKYLIKVFLYYMLISILVFTTFFQIKRTDKFIEYHAMDNEINDIVNWVDANINKNKVIFSFDNNFIKLLPAITGNYIFLPSALDEGYNYKIIFERLLFLINNFDLDKAKILNKINEKILHDTIFANSFNGIIESNKYYEILNISQINYFELDYLIVERENKLFNLSNNKSIKNYNSIYQNNRFIILKKYP